MDEYLRANNLTPHYVAVTKGPGLALTLVEGIYHAQKIAHALTIPIIHLDHIMGHSITPMKDNPLLQYPYVCQIVSGGHTLTMLVRSATDMVKICCSRSDAWGEVFDKTGRDLGRHETPTGPAMEKVMDEFMDGDKVWSKVLPTTTSEDLKKMVSVCPVDKQSIVQTQLEEYRRILKEVYGKESVSKSLDPSHVKMVLNKLIAQEKQDRYSREALIVEFICAFMPEVPTKAGIVKMINSVKFATDTRADTILSKLRMESSEPSEPLLYQHQVERYRQHLETKENKSPAFKDFVAQTITETILPEPTQSVYSAVLHTAIANSLIADDMTARAQYPDVTKYALTGGVGCNRYIADVIDAALKKVGITFQTVEPRNCSDNAAMIAELAHRVLTEAMTAFPNTDELVDELFKRGMGMIAEEPTLKTVEHTATKRWSGPTVI
jgi:tRNA A37 threonylcarbamoyltransferase TsaD